PDLAPSAPRPRSDVAPEVVVRHAEHGANGWALAETANFRVFHNQARELAEQVARVAERTRTEMHKKWFGGTPEGGNPRCDIFLHANGQAYSQQTGKPAGSPGHSSISMEGSRVLVRRIDLHCDVPTMVQAVLPHETTHTVLAGNFGKFQVPRWADEGLA